jgi:hypothetical protein
MQNINSTTGLKDAIQLLEVEQDIKGQLLKEQLYLALESLKPVNLIRNSIKEISSSPHFIDNVSGIAIGLASGFLSKRMFVGASGNLIRKLIGYILQFGVTNIVAQNSDVIKSSGQSIFQHFLRKRVMNSKNRVS